MFGFIDAVLSFFGFVEQQATIALFCLLVFLLNFAGGLLRGMILAYGGQFKERPLKDRMSFRLCMASLLLVVVYALYYHGALVQNIETGHLIYWAFTMLAAPLLAIIGSEITSLVFAKRIEAKKVAYRKRETAQRAKKFADAEKKREAAERRL